MVEIKPGDIVSIARIKDFNPYDANAYRVCAVHDDGLVRLYDDNNEQNAFYHLVGGPRLGYELRVTRSFGENETQKPAFTPVHTGKRKRLTEIRSGDEDRPTIIRQEGIYSSQDTRFAVGDRVLATPCEGGLRLAHGAYSEVWPCTHVRKKRTKNKK